MKHHGDEGNNMYVFFPAERVYLGLDILMQCALTVVSLKIQVCYGISIVLVLMSSCKTLSWIILIICIAEKDILLIFLSI